MTTAIIFLLVLAVLIFVHELGHFLTARFFGVRVDEFAIGFGPKIFGWRRGNIDYTLRLVPFGGYVKIYGENPDDIVEDKTVGQTTNSGVSGVSSGISFIEAKRWKQAIILFAGVAFNFIFAFLLFFISLSVGTVASSSSYEKYADRMEILGVFVTAVSPGTPADIAGIKAGDVIKGITTKTFVPPALPENSGVEIEKGITVEYVQDVINNSGGAPIVISIDRSGEPVDIEVVGVEGLVAGKSYAIGINMDEVGVIKLPIHIAIYEGAKFTGNIMWATVVGFYDLIASAFRGDGSLSSVTGPIGIAGMVGDAAKLGIVYLMMFTGLISINLGIINLVPFPALDGGRLLIVGIETVMRRAVAPKLVGMANVVGFFILMALMVIVTWRDVARLI